MLRKTSFGYVNFEDECHSKRNGFDFETREGKEDIGLLEIEKRLDELLLKKEQLAQIEDDYVLNEEYKKFLDAQYSVIETLVPVLDRLTELGAFFCQYDPDWGSPDYHRQLSFWSESGYSVARGYSISSTALDMVSEPPPPLVGTEGGGFLVGPHNWIESAYLCPYCKAEKNLKIRTQMVSSYEGDSGGAFCEGNFRLGEQMPWFETEEPWMESAYLSDDDVTYFLECCSTWCNDCKKEFFTIVKFVDKTPVEIIESGSLEEWPDGVIRYEQGNR